MPSSPSSKDRQVIRRQISQENASTPSPAHNLIFDQDADTSTRLSILSLCRTELFNLSVGLSALILNSYTNVLFPSILGAAVDQLNLYHYNDPGFIRLAANSTALFLLGGLSSLIRTWSIGSAYERIRYRIQYLLFHAYLNKDLSTQQSDASSAEFIALVDKDSKAAAELCTEKLAFGIRSINSSIYGSILLYRISPTLCLASLTVLPILGIGAMTLSRRLKRLEENLRQVENQSLDFALERISQLRTVRINQKAGVEKHKYLSYLTSSIKFAHATHFSKGIFMGFINFSTNLSLFAVLTVGGRLIANHEISTGKLVQFSIQSIFVGLGFSGLSTFYTDMKKGYQTLARIETALELRPDSIDKPTELVIAQCPSLSDSETIAAIRLEGLCFSYLNRSELVLRDLSLEIPAKSITAFMGISGSGKSSLMSILANIYRPSLGKIFYGESDLHSSMDVASYYRMVGIVEQEQKLLSGTIAENISYGLENASSDDIIAAAKLAYAHDFIMSLPEQYDTQVGLNGSMLSGGQKSRICLARALIKRPSILLLDEVTSALDEASEEAIIQTLVR
jgi:ABC-type multidrug transport system fused ATPase/permease subunit